MQWSATVLSTVSSDTEPSIVVTFDSYKYLFNVSENTNRTFLQSNRNWKRTKAVFLTRASTERAGGLPGLLMTFADATIPRLDVVGPPGLKHYMASMRYYTFRDSMPVIPTETSSSLSGPSSDPNPVFKDDNIYVFSIPVYPSSEIESESEFFTAETGKRKLTAESDDQPPAKRPHTDSASTLDDENLQRSLMIDVMFPASPKARESGSGHNNKRGKKRNQQTIKETKELENGAGAGTANVDEYRRPRLPSGFHSQLPKFNPHQPLVAAYVVVGPRVRGKFDAVKAKELGIPNGSLRQKLTQGETITFTVTVDDGVDEDGKMKKKKETRTVKPEEVIGPSDPPGVILILDVPTPAHIPSIIQPFIDSSFYKRFRSNADEDLAEYAVRTVFHICGEGVLEDERYKSFMCGFWKDTHHVVASREYCPDPITFTSAAYNQLRLSQLDPQIFPVPNFYLTPKKDIPSIPDLPPNVQLMSANQIISIRPPLAPAVDKEAEEMDRFHPVITSATGISLPDDTRVRFEEAKKRVEAAETVKKNSGSPEIPGADVRIITLGTGSACPSKYRNVSATLIIIPNYGNILLDCGEGTWGQLARHFGTDKEKEMNVWRVLKDLKCIYVSHVHGDHHMGVAQLLKKRKQFVSQPSEPLYLVTIRAVHLYLRELSDLEDLGIFDDPSKNGVVTILSPALHWKQYDSYPDSGIWQVGGEEPWLDLELSRENARAMYQKLGLEAFSTVDVRHRTRCYGAIIRHNDGWNIVYSGDTLPSETLVRAAQSPTVLIHEATMADDQGDLAAKKAHSTVGQALDIGRRMNAKNILLTHFSARYPQIPKYKAEGDNQEEAEYGFDPSNGVVAVAFDHADMKIGDMWKINYYLPALESSYQQTVVEEGEDGDVIGESGTMEVDVSR